MAPDPVADGVSVSVRVLVVRASATLLALRASVVREVVLLPALARPPGLPRFIDGFLNLRGELTPVLRLDTLFGMAPVSVHLYAPVVVVRDGAGCIGLLTERAIGLRSVPAADIKPVANHHVFNDCVEGEITIDPEHGMAALLSVPKLLLDAERAAVEDFRAKEAQRLAALASVEGEAS